MVCLRLSAVRAFLVTLGPVLVLGAVASVRSPLAAQVTEPAIVGVWALNAELSDKPPAPPDDGDAGRGRGGRGGGGRRGGGGGGFGGGLGGGRGGFGGARGGRGGNPEDMQRRRNAMRDLFEAPERLTIISTGSMVIVTTADGRTTRLAPDGTKVKDESTGIERRTRWDAGKLVSEITGAFGGRVTETYAVQAETGKLEVIVAGQGRDGDKDARGSAPANPGPGRRVYDRTQ